MMYLDLNRMHFQHLFQNFDYIISKKIEMDQMYLLNTVIDIGKQIKLLSKLNKYKFNHY
jgi:hypothetical protein